MRGWEDVREHEMEEQDEVAQSAGWKSTVETYIEVRLRLKMGIHNFGDSLIPENSDTM